MKTSFLTLAVLALAVATGAAEKQSNVHLRVSANKKLPKPVAEGKTCYYSTDVYVTMYPCQTGLHCNKVSTKCEKGESGNELESEDNVEYSEDDSVEYSEDSVEYAQDDSVEYSQDDSVEYSDDVSQE